MESNNLISGWTPKTDNLLGHHQNKNYDDERSCGYDIIDHAFPTYISNILNELKVNGWLDDIDRGTKGKLQPAKTKMDIDMNNLLQSFNANQFMDNDGMLSNNNSNNVSGGSSVRGDKSAFVSRNERMEDTFPERYPFLSKLISSIELTAYNRLGKKDASSNADIQYFDFDTSLTSVQVAQYPGDGISGYPRHCDRGAKCNKEDMNSTKAERLLTFVYYLTPSGWDSEVDGGALRMFLPSKQETDINSDTHFDVMPYSDRLVVFRSDMIEHEVMPSLRRDRIAITVWLYGKVVHENVDRVNSFPNDLSVIKSTTQSAGSASTSLPPPLPTSSDDRQDDIIVLIPSFRDKETWPTIKSLIETARFPHRVYIGVVFQVDTTSKAEVTELTTEEGSGISIDPAKWDRQKQLRTIIMDYRHATGPCYARYLAQSLHRGEEYVLQIDSHMRFRMNWDSFLIRQLNKTKRPEKSVLTAYPPGYDSNETRATILVPSKFDNDGMLRQKGRLLRSDYKHDKENDNIPCLLYAGGFNFSHSSILDVCPYEKHHHLFFGEEISMAVRLYTHGIDLYAPPQTVCYHKWERNPLRVREDIDSLKAKQRKDSLNVVRMQLQGLGTGLGTVRTTAQFSNELGVDFNKQVLGPGCENVELSEDAFVSQKATSLLPNVTKEEDLGSNADMNTVLKLVGEYMKGA